jgi:hypothetical protein
VAVSRVLSVYKPASRNGATAQPTSQTSSGVADVKTFTPPDTATAVLLSAKATSARVTFDGSIPSPATPCGLILVAGAQPCFFPLAGTLLKFCSDVAGSSELSPLWLE